MAHHKRREAIVLNTADYTTHPPTVFPPRAPTMIASLLYRRALVATRSLPVSKGAKYKAACNIRGLFEMGDASDAMSMKRAEKDVDTLVRLSKFGENSVIMSLLERKKRM